MTNLRDDWIGRRVLVTGATGLVGWHLLRKLLELNAEVICFVRDADPASPLWASGDIDRVALCSGRLENFEHVKSALVEREIDTVFHLGAQTIVGAGRRDPMGTFESNIRGTWHVLEACRLYGDRVKRIVIASSDKAYGDCDTLPYTEATPLAGRNPYDVSKSCCDLIAQSYACSYGLPVAIARCGNIFGPGDLNWSRLVPGTIRSALDGQRPIIRSDGTPLRDYIYVDDVVDAYLSLSAWLDAEARDGGGCAFNFAIGRPMTALEMTRRILIACRRADVEPVILNQTSGEIAAQHLDCSRAAGTLGWQARWPLDDALTETVAWYRHHLHASPAPAHKLVMPAADERPARASA